jgi:hypothetical protein
MKPFDLNKALEGYPVVTRDGREVDNIRKIDGVTKGPNLIGVLDGRLNPWSEDGTNISSDRDLFMKPTKTKYTVITGNPPYEWVNELAITAIKNENMLDDLKVSFELKRWKDQGYTNLQTHNIERDE